MTAIILAENSQEVSNITTTERLGPLLGTEESALNVLKDISRRTIVKEEKKK